MATVCMKTDILPQTILDLFDEAQVDFVFDYECFFFLGVPGANLNSTKGNSENDASEEIDVRDCLAVLSCCFFFPLSSDLMFFVFLAAWRGAGTHT